MSERYDRREDGVDVLRSRMDAEARFHRILSGYDPEEVRAYVEEVKRIFSQQARAAKQEQETLIAQLDSAKSEIQARNCAIKTLKESLTQRETQLATASTRITTLIQSVKAQDAEHESVERLRAAAATARVTAERVQGLEKEVQQLRATLSQAASVIEVWKSERTQLIDENARLRHELEEFKKLITATLSEQEIRRAPRAEAPSRPAPVNVNASGLEGRVAQQGEAAQDVSSQLADKLAGAFAEAYTLVSQLRTGGAEAQHETVAPRPTQSRIQVLRPDGSAADCNFGGK